MSNLQALTQRTRTLEPYTRWWVVQEDTEEENIFAARDLPDLHEALWKAWRPRWEEHEGDPKLATVAKPVRIEDEARQTVATWVLVWDPPLGTCHEQPHRWTRRWVREGVTATLCRNCGTLMTRHRALTLDGAPYDVTTVFPFLLEQELLEVRERKEAQGDAEDA